MTKQRMLTKDEILAQLPAARAREAADRKAGLRATAAWYDHASGYIMMTLTSHRLFGVRASDIPFLKGATVAQLGSVELSPSGSGLHWEALDVDLSVPGLLIDSIGRTELARNLAKIKSPARAKASRANGAKGGRPRKKRASSREL